MGGRNPTDCPRFPVPISNIIRPWDMLALKICIESGGKAIEPFAVQERHLLTHISETKLLNISPAITPGGLREVAGIHLRFPSTKATLEMGPKWAFFTLLLLFCRIYKCPQHWESIFSPSFLKGVRPGRRGRLGRWGKWRGTEPWMVK